MCFERASTLEFRDKIFRLIVLIIKLISLGINSDLERLGRLFILNNIAIHLHQFTLVNYILIV